MTQEVKEEVIKETKSVENKRERAKREFDKESWKPKTELGKEVKEGKINSLKEILDSGRTVLEPEIVDVLIPTLKTDLLLIGQAKGKFGGGQRRAFRQTQKKTKEGNKPKFATYAIVGNENGLVGIGYGKAKETVPAREKAFRNAKLNMISIRRACGSWKCGCKESHSIPFAVEGKQGSCKIKLMPAPKGVGLCIEKECAKILEMAGIKDIWSKTTGQTKTKLNLIRACFKALKKLSTTKIQQKHIESLGIIEGPLTIEKKEEENE